MKDKNELIWVVDDDPVFKLIFSMTLKRVPKTFDLEEFKSGQAARDNFLKLVESTRPLPEYIFLDINMPEINGWQFLESAVDGNVDRSTLPSIFIVSSSINPEDKELAGQNEYVADYLTKPIDEKQLAKLLNAQADI
jgi:CheY-like chemotaxis protein